MGIGFVPELKNVPVEILDFVLYFSCGRMVALFSLLCLAALHT